MVSGRSGPAEGSFVNALGVPSDGGIPEQFLAHGEGKLVRLEPSDGNTQPPDLLSSLQFCLAGRVEIFGFGLGENSQNINQVARGAADCLCGSALEALAKSFSEFQENTFVARIAELRLGPCPNGTFRFENTVFHLPVPDRQRLVLFAEHGLEEGFNKYVH
jgi:hypothetical protein